MDSTSPPLGETEEQKDIRLHKDTAAFGYLWVLSLPVYFTKKDSKFVRFHAKQGIVLFLLSIPCAMIPYIGRLFLFVLAIGMLVGFINAAQGRYAEVPVIGELARGNLKAGELMDSILRALRHGLEALEKMAGRHQKDAKKGEGTVDSTPKPPVP